ncbi:MAG: hypothetical protein ISR76_04885 [Planctomycetes bacterium]|nr:hypothetical protein [Planctomycetota bacterium]MBL7008311.1 hypothetical protein [Planctomycetota bacterium]
MWLFTRFGYFEASAPNAASVQEGRPVHLRARRRSHLLNLQRAYPELRSLPVLGSRAAGWHLAMTRTAWAHLLGQLARDLDYQDFLQGVREGGHCDLAYYEKLGEVAAAVGELQGA